MYLKVFKPEDVQDADGFEILFALNPAVDLLDDPLEAAGVKCHGQRVSAIDGLWAGEKVLTAAPSSRTPSLRGGAQPRNAPRSLHPAPKSLKGAVSSMGDTSP